MIAYTSRGAYEYLRSKNDDIDRLRGLMKGVAAEEVVNRVEKMMATERDLRKQIETLQAKAAGGEVEELIGSATAFNGGRLIAAVLCPDAQGVKRLRDLSDRIKQKAPDAIVVFGMKDPEAEKASLLVAVGPKAPANFDSNAILKELAPLIEGRGGGKKEMAQAGGTKPAGLDAAIAQARKTIVG